MRGYVWLLIWLLVTHISPFHNYPALILASLLISYFSFANLPCHHHCFPLNLLSSPVSVSTFSSVRSCLLCHLLGLWFTPVSFPLTTQLFSPLHTFLRMSSFHKSTQKLTARITTATQEKEDDQKLEAYCDMIVSIYLEYRRRQFDNWFY